MTTQAKTVVTEALVSRKSEGPGGISPRKPDWPWKLFLKPHHFQQQDRYHEDLVRHALRLGLGNPWGLVDGELDEAAVGSGQIAIRHLRAIFPDGTPVAIGADGAIPPRYFDAKLRGRETLDVYAALPLERAGEGMVEPRAGVNPRYLAESATVADFNTGQNALQIPWGRPNVQVLFEGETLDGCSVLKVARLRKTPGGIQLDGRFVPPVLRIRASPGLEARIRDVERCSLAALAAVSDARPGGGDTTANDAVRLLLGSTLGREIALVQSILSSESAHPREAYRVVAELVGALAAFAPTGRAQIPAFDPLALEGTFDTLVNEARTVLDAIAAPQVRNIVLERYDDTLWHAALREPGIFGREFLLVLSGGDSNTHAQSSRVVRVAAWEEMAQLIQAAVGGVPLLPELRRPRGISLPSDATCFRLDKKSPAWTSITKNGSIAVCLPAASPLKVMLLTLEPGVLGAGS